MTKEYVQQIEGAYRVAGSRVSLESIVCCFWDGMFPEAIVQSFPTLTLEQVYGAIAFYLANRELIDDYIRQGDAEYEAARLAQRDADPLFYQKLEDARRRMRKTA